MIDLKRKTNLRDSIELFYFAYRAFTSHPDNILEEKGLGRVHHRILYFVGQNPDLTIGDLLKILKVNKQALNLPLLKLIRMNLITIQSFQGDRRFKQMRLTEEGLKLEARLTESQIEYLSSVFNSMPLDQQAVWKEVIKRISEA